MTRASKRECAPSALTGIKPSLATTSADNRSNASVKPAPNEAFLTPLSLVRSVSLGVQCALMPTGELSNSTRESENSASRSTARAPINNVHYPFVHRPPHFSLVQLFMDVGIVHESHSVTITVPVISS